MRKIYRKRSKGKQRGRGTCLAVDRSQVEEKNRPKKTFGEEPTETISNRLKQRKSKKKQKELGRSDQKPPQREKKNNLIVKLKFVQEKNWIRNKYDV